MAGSSSAVVRAYLILYNAVLTFGWAYVLVLAVQEYTSTNSPKFWPAVEFSLKIFQTAAVMEIVHALVRIVPSNVFLTFFQVFSRVFVLWGVLHLSPPSQTSIGVPMLLAAWTITEIIRYGYYVLHLIGMSSFVQWLRYTLFIVLYPIGVTGELLCLYQALFYVSEKKILYVEMPNPFNVAFDYQYFLAVTMLSYIPLFPQLYLHMFAQRRKILGNASKKSA